MEVPILFVYAHDAVRILELANIVMCYYLLPSQNSHGNGQYFTRQLSYSVPCEHEFILPISQTNIKYKYCTHHDIYITLQHLIYAILNSSYDI
jgi:hypothetical protein